MDNLNDDLTKIPLSGDDLIEIVTKLGRNQDEIGWVTYDGLHMFDSLHDLFNTKQIDTLFILMQPPGEDVGHWVTLGMSVRQANTFWFYDPYAFSIEDDLKITKSDDILLEFLRGVMVDVNTHRHQKLGTDNGSEINTCGRHDAVRALFNHLSNDEYNSRVIMPLIDKKVIDNPDTIVNLMTAFLSDSDKVVEQFLSQ